MEFKVKLENGDKNLLPTKNTPTDAGYDLKANKVMIFGVDHSLVEADFSNGFTVNPGERVLVQTGITIELQPGWEAQIRPRSGLALKNGITVTNSPGTIDAGYRGIIGVIFHNLGNKPLRIQKYDRIAQMVISKVEDTSLVIAEDVDENTERSDGGFGSSGTEGKSDE